MWVFKHTDENVEPLKRVMREYLFDSTFIIAANVMVGRRLLGRGITNLRQCALSGAALRLGPEGMKVSYHWVDKSDIAREKLIRTRKAPTIMTPRVTWNIPPTFKRQVLTKVREEIEKILRRFLMSIGNNTRKYKFACELRTACHI